MYGTILFSHHEANSEANTCKIPPKLEILLTGCVVAQDVRRHVWAHPHGPAEGWGSGLGPASNTLFEPGLQGAQGGVYPERILV